MIKNSAQEFLLTSGWAYQVDNQYDCAEYTDICTVQSEGQVAGLSVVTCKGGF